MTDIDALARKIRDQIPTTTVTEQRVPIRPFIIEFSGTPKSGKSYVSSRLETVLGNNGFRVLLIPEAAASNPLARKEDMLFNIWNALTTLSGIIEEADNHRAHVVIFDRGLFDILIWMEWHRLTGRLTDKEHENIAGFFLMEQWRRMVDIVFLLNAGPEVARRRDTEGLTDNIGRVMNVETLKQINEAVEITYGKYKHLFRYVQRVDTTGLDPAEGTRKIVSMTLTTFQECAQERLVVVNRSACANILEKNRLVYAHESGFESLIQFVNNESFMEVRPRAEANNELIQIVCGAVLMSGDRILFLRRREQKPQHPLHDQYVIWAGGHARDHDRAESNFFESCLRRELAEELSIKTKYQLSPLGYIFDPSTSGGSRHLLILFMAKLESDDVSISMSAREFKDKSGMSISGHFLLPQEIKEHWRNMEPWSRKILSDYFKIQPHQEDGPLFDKLAEQR